MSKKRQPIIELCRCLRAKGDQYIDYHDKEWGVPVHDDRLLFEFLILEGAQAGLSWITILKKTRQLPEGFRPVRPPHRRQVWEAEAAAAELAGECGDRP